jgi:hypothetical protein
MCVWPRAAAGCVLAALLAAGCRNPLGREYEYEEQVYISVDGAATAIVDSSIPALVALHHLPLDPSLSARVDRDRIRSLFEAVGCEDVRVGQPWVRRGRHFIQVRVSAEHVADLARCGPLGWSSYRLEPDEDGLRYEQTVGPPDVGPVPPQTWTGSELVGFKLHVPSRITYHNVKRLDSGENGAPDRGNILTWEQRLSDRLAGRPLQFEVRMDSQSILFRTLWLFVGAFGAAVTALASTIWITVRRARRRPAPIARS